jgi:1-acyl-sn-glycerol-3-phosphate acyltransferase
MAAMRRWVSRWVRIVGTGIAFLVFGAVAFLLAVAILPVARRLPGSDEEAELRAQRAMHGAFRFYVWLASALRLIDVDVRGGETLREPGGRVVVANHPTLLDAILLGALMPQMDCVVKSAAWSNPVMRGAVRAAGYVPNELGDRLVAVCAERVARGRPRLLFPEGTRSPAEGLGDFRRGAAHIALRSGRPLLPVFIECDPPSLLRGDKWYDVPPRRLRFTLEVGEPIDPRGTLDRAEPAGAQARELTAALRDRYEKRLHTLPAWKPDAPRRGRPRR